MQRNYSFVRILPMGSEIKRERFKKVAGNRVQRILDTLTLLSNCANRNNYDYKESDVKLMFTEIDKALKNTKEVFAANSAREDEKFKFLD